MTIEVPLRGGYAALIDDADAPDVLRYKWYASKRFERSNPIIYAYRRGSPGEVCTIYLHRHLLTPPKGMVVDHYDNNGLNNQRSNLRILTQSENTARAIRWSNRNGFPGVAVIGGGRWVGTVTRDGRHYETEACLSPEDAALARAALLLQVYGAHVIHNAPPEQASAL